MSSEEPTTEPERTLNNEDWNKLLKALKTFADREIANEKTEQQRFKEEQRQFEEEKKRWEEEKRRWREEKKIWKIEKWLLIANLVVSSIHLIIAILKLFRK